jgi:CelD/BcsL family acetyltransferase involved in cellulose biosynthesis
VSGLVVKCLSSPAELRRVAPGWNELWQRSDSVRPTARAELVALWCECFARGRPLAAITVESAGTMVAALPVVLGRVFGVRAGTSSDNHWSTAGELLLDHQCDSDHACAALLGGLRQSGLGLLWLDGVRADSAGCQSLLGAAREGGHSSFATKRFSVAEVEIAGTWAEYLATRSRNHRHQVKAIARRATKQGTLELARLDVLAPQQVEAVLQTCFEIEARGWKGQAEGAVLRADGMWDFFLEQARQLATWQELSITMLRLDGSPIAFEYGWRAKSVLAALKVAYDETHQRLSPGQLLRYLLIEQLHDDRSVRRIDYLGPVTKATAQWATHGYDVGRVMVAVSGLGSRAAIAGYRYGRPLVHRLRRQGASADPRPADEQAEASAAEPVQLEAAPGK